jgi:predicted lipoprotein with Yx(FWY)xxD motif
LLAISTLALGAALALGCGGDDERSRAVASGSTVSSSSSAAKPADAARRGSTVKVMRTRYGRILVDGNGRALYLFTRERGKPPSRCYGSCAVAWPPFFTKGRPRAGSGAKARLIGTTRRRDGRTQVTYKGSPLYYYVTDRKPGQVTCQDVTEYGGTWLVVAPSGNAIG